MRLRVALVSLTLFLHTAVPQSARVQPGTLPLTWRSGGPNCLEVPDWQVHEYNADFFILRQSGCTHYEKPFLYLLFGKDRALLEDTGAGKPDTARIVVDVIAKWAQRNKRPAPPLLVVHSHGHGDHTAGDAQLKALPNVEVVPASVPEMQKAFGIANWPADIGKIELGGRTVDVIPIPGHHVASIALYDRATGVLLTGDSLYPGRLYVFDFSAFAQSTKRVVEFTRDRPVAHILGTHIEQSRTPFVDYPTGTLHQPDEHSLELSRGALLELDAALAGRGALTENVALRDFTIVPQRPRPR